MTIESSLGLQRSRHANEDCGIGAPDERVEEALLFFNYEFDFDAIYRPIL